MKCSQLKIKTMKSKAKKDVIEYKKQPNLVVKLKKRCKTGFFDNLETKITLKRFGQRLVHGRSLMIYLGMKQLVVIYHLAS